MKIPYNNKWTQESDSDVASSVTLNNTLNTSFNLDLSTNKGATRISPRTTITTDDITNLGIASGFIRFNAGTAGFYTIAGDRIFNTAGIDPSLAFADSSTGNTGGSSDTSDIIHFKKANMLVASQGGSSSSLVYYNGSWNSYSTLSMTGGTVHMMCEFDERLYVTENYKKIYSVNSSIADPATSGTNTFSLGTLDANNVGLRLVDILSTSDRIWILTATSQYGSPAIIYDWDGVTADTPNTEEGYILDSSAVMCGIVKDDTLYIINAEAELLVFNGGTFVRVNNGKLPVNPSKYLKNTFSSVNNRWIHPRGITISDEGKINILINNVYEDDTVEERLPSGIWEFDLSNTSLGWYHKAALSLYTSSVIDFGQNRVARVGALKYVKTPNKNGQFLVGAQLYTDASSTKEVILTNNTTDTIQKFGYLVTNKFLSGNITDIWQKVYARFKKFTNVTDKIIVKYRTDDPTPTSATITWTSTTTFTTTTDVSGKEGYEVEVLQGKGSGKCSHITTISENAGTYTVTVDEEYTGATSGTAKARIQNWQKIGTLSEITSSTLESSFGGDTTPWVQVKVCLQLTGKGELYDLELTNN